MNLPRHIGIAGRAGTGKDTLASLIVGTYDYHKYSIAYTLKEEVIHFLSKGITLDGIKFKKALRRYCKDLSQASRFLTLRTLWKNNIDMMDVTYRETKEIWFREFLQWWGSDVRRVLDENYWLDRMPWTEKLVVPDVRFLNEVRRIKAEGGVTIYLCRNMNEYNGIFTAPEHHSEALHPDDCDFRILWPRDDVDNCLVDARRILVEEIGLMEADWQKWHIYMEALISETE